METREEKVKGRGKNGNGVQKREKAGENKSLRKTVEKGGRKEGLQGGEGGGREVEEGEKG